MAEEKDFPLAAPDLTKLVRAALGLSNDWTVMVLKDASVQWVSARSGMFSSYAVTVSAVSPQAWGGIIPPAAMPVMGFYVPSGYLPFRLDALYGHGRDYAMLELFMAGWWGYHDNGAQKRIYLLPRPDVKMKDGRMHCEDGPAVIWPDAQARHLYYLEGVEVPKEAIAEPLKLPDLAISHENAEVRRVLANFYGHERLMRERGKLIQEDDFGKLWGLPTNGLLQNSAFLQMVEVLNSTPEPNGSFRRYMLRVPPQMRTAKEAVAWTFGMGEKEYQPEVQT